MILLKTAKANLSILSDATFLEIPQNIRANTFATALLEQVDLNHFKIWILKVILHETHKAVINLDYVELLNVGKITIKIFLLIILIPTPYFLHIGTDRLGFKCVY